MKAATLVLGAVLTLVPFGPARAAITYGALGNFDCINDTGSTAHGFEIELDGCLPANVFSTFGSPYNRYGNPMITTDGVNTFVRYESAYVNGVWAVGTDSGTFAPTGGHSLFFPQYGGDPAYPNVPGDHFGVALDITPTNTIYRWLLDDGNGTLVAAGTTVKLPAPILTVVPPANPANQAGVQAVVQAPPPENGQGFGDAIWAKVFTTVVENAGPVELGDLVLGNAAVPPETETEIEWQLLQSNKAGFSKKVDNSDVAKGNESVVRRYEFYAYTGGYDPEDHEALNDLYAPQYVGAFLGNQNVAANLLADQAVPEPSTLVLGGMGTLSLAIGACVRRWRPRAAA
jgi:hypothetical protein